MWAHAQCSNVVVSVSVVETVQKHPRRPSPVHGRACSDNLPINGHQDGVPSSIGSEQARSFNLEKGNDAFVYVLHGNRCFNLE